MLVAALRLLGDLEGELVGLEVAARQLRAQPAIQLGVGVAVAQVRIDVLGVGYLGVVVDQVALGDGEPQPRGDDVLLDAGNLRRGLLDLEGPLVEPTLVARRGTRDGRFDLLTLCASRQDERADVERDRELLASYARDDV